MWKLLHKADVNGYAPFGGLNLFIGAIPMVVALLSTITSSNGQIEIDIAVKVAVVSAIILFIRNLKCKNIFKTIIFTIITLAISSVIAAIVIFFGGGDPEKSSGGQSSNESSGSNWKEQYSQTKGTYYTDGQGNFRDQNGNDVYNPQKVEDYDKL